VEKTNVPTELFFAARRAINARLIARCPGPRPFDGRCGFLRRFGWCGHFVMVCRARLRPLWVRLPTPLPTPANACQLPNNAAAPGPVPHFQRLTLKALEGRPGKPLPDFQLPSNSLSTPIGRRG